MDGFTLAKFVHLINQKSRQQAINTEASGTAPEAKTQQFAYSGQVSKKTALRHAKKALEQWMSLPEEEKNTRAEKQLAKKLPSLLELIEKVIAEG